jgi:fatty-acyl-CoA synthase
MEGAVPAFVSWVRSLADQLPAALHGLAVIRRAGLLPMTRPDLMVSALLAASQTGPIAGAACLAAARNHRAVGLVDELGSLTFGQLHGRSNALARALSERGLGTGSTVGLLAMNHRGAVDTMIAAGKLGARLLLINTGLAAPELVEVASQEGVSALVYDEEFTAVAGALPHELPRFLAWTDRHVAPEYPMAIEDLIAGADHGPVRLAHGGAELVLLTSGTTGPPKGAARRLRNPLVVSSLLDRIPLRMGECTVLAAPLFHATGLSQLVVSMALGSTAVMRRTFDAEATVQAVRDHRATVLVLVPTMLRRILDLGPEVLGRYDTSSLRVLFSAGSALSPELGNRATEAFGEVLHNVYGSTEVALATVATPQDWRAAPGTVGRPPVGCRVVLYDAAGHPINEPDVLGRVFVGGGMSIPAGGGHDGDTIDGLRNTGDVGHLDAEGRLFIDGRDDDMVVSGGENVFPAEVENVLAEHDGVLEAAVVGIPDAEYGQRLRAYVVPAQEPTPDPEELRAHVRARLARFKVPREVVFVSELPRNATGKVVRGRLG